MKAVLIIVVSLMTVYSSDSDELEAESSKNRIVDFAAHFQEVWYELSLLNQPVNRDSLFSALTDTLRKNIKSSSSETIYFRVYRDSLPLRINIIPLYSPWWIYIAKNGMYFKMKYQGSPDAGNDTHSKKEMLSFYSRQFFTKLVTSNSDIYHFPRFFSCGEANLKNSTLQLPTAYYGTYCESNPVDTIQIILKDTESDTLRLKYIKDADHTLIINSCHKRIHHGFIITIPDVKYTFHKTRKTTFHLLLREHKELLVTFKKKNYYYIIK